MTKWAVVDVKNNVLSSGETRTEAIDKFLSVSESYTDCERAPRWEKFKRQDLVRTTLLTHGDSLHG